MLSIPELFGKLLRRRRQPFPPAPQSEKIGRDCEQPMAFAEIFAAAVYADFGVLPFEFWPEYRNARKADDQDGWFEHGVLAGRLTKAIQFSCSAAPRATKRHVRYWSESARTRGTNSSRFSAPQASGGRWVRREDVLAAVRET